MTIQPRSGGFPQKGPLEGLVSVRPPDLQSVQASGVRSCWRRDLPWGRGRQRSEAGKERLGKRKVNHERGRKEPSPSRTPKQAQGRHGASPSLSPSEGRCWPRRAMATGRLPELGLRLCTEQPSPGSGLLSLTLGIQRRLSSSLQSPTQVLCDPDTRKAFPESSLYPPSPAPRAPQASSPMTDCLLWLLLPDSTAPAPSVQCGIR